MYDEKKDGFINPDHLKEIILQTSLFNPKEINIIVRHLKSDPFDCKTFENVLFDVRFELAKSRLTDTNIDKLEDHLVYQFSQIDVEQTGLVSMMDIK